MKIGDIRGEQSKIDVEGEVVEKGESRTVGLRLGGTGQVCDLVIRDSSGSIKLTLWNESIEKVEVGDSIRVSNGYTKAFRGELDLLVGRHGSFTVL